MNSEHTPGAPIVLNCGFCARMTSTVINTSDESMAGVFPICDVCIQAMNAIVHEFGYDVHGWELSQIIHGSECRPGEPGGQPPVNPSSQPTPPGTPPAVEALQVDSVLDEVSRILGAPQEGQDDGSE